MVVGGGIRAGGTAGSNARLSAAINKNPAPAPPELVLVVLVVLVSELDIDIY